MGNLSGSLNLLPKVASRVGKSKEEGVNEGVTASLKYFVFVYYLRAVYPIVVFYPSIHPSIHPCIHPSIHPNRIERTRETKGGEESCVFHGPRCMYHTTIG